MAAIDSQLVRYQLGDSPLQIVQRASPFSSLLLFGRILLDGFYRNPKNVYSQAIFFLLLRTWPFSLRLPSLMQSF